MHPQKTIFPKTTSLYLFYIHAFLLNAVGSAGLGSHLSRVKWHNCLKDKMKDVADVKVTSAAVAGNRSLSGDRIRERRPPNLRHCPGSRSLGQGIIHNAHSHHVWRVLTSTRSQTCVSSELSLKCTYKETGL